MSQETIEQLHKIQRQYRNELLKINPALSEIRNSGVIEPYLFANYTTIAAIRSDVGSATDVSFSLYNPETNRTTTVDANQVKTCDETIPWCSQQSDMSNHSIQLECIPSDAKALARTYNVWQWNQYIYSTYDGLYSSGAVISTISDFKILRMHYSGEIVIPPNPQQHVYDLGFV